MPSSSSPPSSSGGTDAKASTPPVGEGASQTKTASSPYDGMNNYKSMFCIRTITMFITLQSTDFDQVVVDDKNSETSSQVETKIAHAIRVGREIQRKLVEDNGYQVQTIRLVTNPFPEWFVSSAGDGKNQQQEHEHQRTKIRYLDTLLQKYEIEFCSVGCASTQDEIRVCSEIIIPSSSRISCSAVVHACDVDMATSAAQCVLDISKLDAPDFLQNGLGNFRFCVTGSTTKDYIPFFPVARSAPSSFVSENTNNDTIRFAIGLENGPLVRHLLTECHSISNISTIFRQGYSLALIPIQRICQEYVSEHQQHSTNDQITVEYLGIDTSLNPSLDPFVGSIASAIEQLDEIHVFGGPGTLAAAAAITECIQTLDQCQYENDDTRNHTIQLCGYNGLMLPLCEDTRLAELATQGMYGIQDLFAVSQVCGVGIDTVPIPCNVSLKELSNLILDVVGCAQRWKKSLSCRVFPVPNKYAGDVTTFDFQHLVNSRVLPIRSSSLKTGTTGNTASTASENATSTLPPHVDQHHRRIIPNR